MITAIYYSEENKLVIINKKIDLDFLQKEVEGLIEAIYIPEISENIVCYGNDEAKLIGLKPSFYIANHKDAVFGNVVFVGDNGNGVDRGLKTNEIEEIVEFLLQNILSDELIINNKISHELRIIEIER